MYGRNESRLRDTQIQTLQKHAVYGFILRRSVNTGWRNVMDNTDTLLYHYKMIH